MLGRKLLAVLLGLVLVVGISASQAAANKTANNKQDTIIFIPHDSRPISNEQTADTVRMLGYEVLVPPEELLGGRNKPGDPEGLWQWVEGTVAAQAKADKGTGQHKIKAIVASSDTMVYGSLVGSRRHEMSKSEILERAGRFGKLHSKYPSAKLYVFSSIMRTPKSGEYSGDQEPDYYKSYGADIFRYTVLTDMQGMKGLSSREEKELKFLTRLIPKQALKDWLNRRSKNFEVNRKLIDLTREGVFSYFSLGQDDNAPFSQTHKESRELSAYGKDLGATKFQSMAGIDEFGMLMLARAVNDLTNTIPFVYVKYNWGSGGNTVPSYSGEKISASIRSHIICAGGMEVTSPARADLVLLVNTNPNGETGEANWRENNEKPRTGTNYFVSLVQDAVNAGQPIGIADVSYANGSDNALMAGLRDNGLLFKVRSYAGWNTATNSAGFALGQGILAARMNSDDVEKLLMVRYLDDWAYQANVRQIMARQLGWFRASSYYSSLNEKRREIEDRSSRLMQYFAENNIPLSDERGYFQVTYPWNRMFEARVTYGKYSE